MKLPTSLCHANNPAASSVSDPVPPEVRGDLAVSLAVALLEHSREQQAEITWLREQLQFACAMLRRVDMIVPPQNVVWQ
jgi:hypothetical protein